MKAIYLCDSEFDFNRVFTEKVRAELSETLSINSRLFNRDDVCAERGNFKETEYIFSTWGMPYFSSEEVRKYFPSLKCVFYAAGSVQMFARPFLENGVKVYSAWAANAVPVAEYTVAQIILANKGFFTTSRLMSDGNHTQAVTEGARFCGNYGAKVGIIGAGMIGSLVIRMLKMYELDVLVFDPFLPDDAARRLGVEKCCLEELFASSQVVSNHLANNAQTRGMLNYPLFSSMRPNAVFLNTGRGAQVVESDLARVLSEREDITAILDVTDPEPPESGHEFYSLKNCILTPHIAGSSGAEVQRMAYFMIDEFKRFAKGERCLYEVTEEMLKTMA